MRLEVDAIRRLCSARRWSLARLLREAEVSPNAFYSLARKASLLPRSVHRLASTLGVPATQILAAAREPESRARELLGELEGVLRKRPRTSRENAWHTLLLLDLPPVERLKRGLLRGQTSSLHR